MAALQSSAAAVRGCPDAVRSTALQPGEATSTASRIDVAQQHQEAAGRQRRIIEPHRKAQVGGAALVDPPGDVEHLPAVPDQRGAEDDRGDAVEDLQPALHAATGATLSTRSGPDMAVGAHELARDDHDRPDHEIDDDLLGKADRLLRNEVARHHLPQRERQRREPEQARRASARRDPTVLSMCGLTGAERRWRRSATISGEMRDSFATWP